MRLSALLLLSLFAVSCSLSEVAPFFAGTDARLDKPAGPAPVMNLSLRLIDHLPPGFSKDLPFRIIQGPVAAGDGGFYLLVDQYRIMPWKKDEPCGKSFQHCGYPRRLFLLFDAAGNGVRSIEIWDYSVRLSDLLDHGIKRLETSVLVQTPLGEELFAADGTQLRTFKAASRGCLGVTAHEIFDGCDGKLEIFDSNGYRTRNPNINGNFSLFDPDTLDEDGSFVVFTSTGTWLHQDGNKPRPVATVGHQRTGPANFIDWINLDPSDLVERLQITFLDDTGRITRQFPYGGNLAVYRHRGGGVALSSENLGGFLKLTASGQQEWASSDRFWASFASGWTLSAVCGHNYDCVPHFLDPAGRVTGESLARTMTVIHPFRDIPEGVTTFEGPFRIYDGQGRLTSTTTLPAPAMFMTRLAPQPLSYSRLGFVDVDATDDPYGPNNEGTVITILPLEKRAVSP